MADERFRKARRNRILLDLIGDKWTVLVFGSLCDHGGRRRFNDIRRDIGEISQRSLTTCLRRLERNGLIERHILATRSLGVEYAFTTLGYTLDTPITSLLNWTSSHATSVRAAQAAFDRSGGGEGEENP